MVARSISKLPLLLSAAALALSPIPALADGPVEGWGLHETDIEYDQSITYGTLPNGMKYAIRFSEVPAEALSVRMHVNFGSVDEAENERGLAHFIEHMAFNGSTNVPEGEMISLLEREGLAFGPDTNAYTAFAETVYQLEVPSIDERRLDLALFLMRETASELTFDAAAVDRERGVVLSEKRVRNTADLRAAVDQFAFFAPGTPYAQRLPIGTDDVISTAPADRLKALYQRQYRPENTTLIVVGAMDPELIESKIMERFESWQAAAPVGPETDLGEVDFSREAAFDTFVDPTIVERVQIRTMRPFVDPKDNVERRNMLMMQRLLTVLFDRRVEQLVEREGGGLIGGGMALIDVEDSATSSTIVAAGNDGSWETVLPALENELRRAIEFGFSERELQFALSNIETDYAVSAEQTEARRNSTIADNIVNVVAEDNFVTTPAYRYGLFQEFAAGLNIEQVNAAFAELWDGSPQLVHITTKAEIETDAIASVYNAARNTAVDPLEESALTVFAYDDFGPAGEVVADDYDAELNIRSIAFANNVRLNIKPTSFAPGSVLYNVKMAGGAFAMPPEANDQAMAIYFQIVGALAGTQEHSFEELQELLAGQAVNYGFSAGLDAFVASGETTSDKLATQMKVSAAYLTDFGFRQSAQDRWEAIIPPVLAQINGLPAQVASLGQADALTDGDERVSLPGQEVLLAFSQDDIAEAYRANAASAAIEIGIVGDVSEADAIAAVRQTFGALPEREAAAPAFAELRTITTSAPERTVTLPHNGAADQAFVLVTWPTTDDDDLETAVGLTMLQESVNVMLNEKLREELGASYGPSVSSIHDATLEDFGYFSVGSLVAPADVDPVLAAIQGVIEEIRMNGLTEDVLARARNPQLEQFAQAVETNDLWVGLVTEAQSRPERLARIAATPEFVEGFTTDDISALARKYFRPEVELTIKVLPASTLSTQPDAE
ncbi:MAG: insulinase family protein [Pseudomonadota bacterium]